VHSADYRNGISYAGKRVLVVGFGNSAGEIAIDLVENGAEVSMAVRGPVNITRKELLGIPILAVSIPLSKLPVAIADAISLAVMRLVFGDAPRYGLLLSRKGAFSQVRDQRRTPLIDIGTMALIRRGQIRILPGIKAFGSCEVEFTDGRKGEFDAVVAATGYRPSCESLFEDSAMFDEGLPRPRAAEANPGLYFTGFNVSPTGTLYQVSREARKIAKAIAVSI
jgi:cation diffusion facilitator CzcD-associated flavoprotein CzcO